MRNKIIKLIEAKYVSDYTVELFFEDGVARKIDFGYFLNHHPHPQHNKYKELRNFKKFKIERNNLVWGKNWDLEFDLWNLYNGRSPK
jgi:hypothetical protein